MRPIRTAAQQYNVCNAYAASALVNVSMLVTFNDGVIVGKITRSPATVARGSRPYLPALWQSANVNLVSYLLTQLPATPTHIFMQFFWWKGARDTYVGITGVRRGSAVVPFDNASASYYRLSIVTMPLTEAVWPQFVMQVFGGGRVQLVPPFVEWRIVGGPNWYHMVAAGQLYLLLQTVFR